MYIYIYTYIVICPTTELMKKLILYALRNTLFYIPVPVKIVTSLSIFNQNQNLLLGIFKNS